MDWREQLGGNDIDPGDRGLNQLMVVWEGLTHLKNTQEVKSMGLQD